MDPDQVAGGIAEGAVADAVGLLERLLNDLGVADLQSFKVAVDVVGRKVDARMGRITSS